MYVKSYCVLYIENIKGLEKRIIPIIIVKIFIEVKIVENVKIQYLQIVVVILNINLIQRWRGKK